jgi:hypothetical protein
MSIFYEFHFKVENPVTANNIFRKCSTVPFDKDIFIEADFLLLKLQMKQNSQASKAASKQANSEQTKNFHKKEKQRRNGR